ncbi:MAG: 5-deoxy-glucuronate isomerase [Opitutaceae bacterium]|nr:5-deoxy-glucuronate isomerase [Opitutaceae bacterium]
MTNSNNRSSHFIPAPAPEFGAGYTKITKAGDSSSGGLDTQMDFGIKVQSLGEVIDEASAKESVWLLISGEAKITLDGAEQTVKRDSIFNEAPTAIHVGPDTPIRIESLSEKVEWAVTRTTNDRKLKPTIYTPDTLSPEFRGTGLVQDACLRNVRLIFDYDTNPEANLVIGEVVNYPGRWSSYPPHHHDQPEIYHYRFTKPQGYGHAELGDDVFKVQQNDTMVIPPQLDHAQVSAPGYGMWYLWVIRHIDGNPYTGFEFTKDHEWTLNANDQGWKPEDQ